MTITAPVSNPAAATVTARPLAVAAWVEGMTEVLRPQSVVWCDGSTGERQRLLDGLVQAGTLIELNQNLRPRSYLARSAPDDVARVESRTFICSRNEADAGPTNNWVDPAEMRGTLDGLFDGAMRGRTMYVVPFAMGPIGGPLTRYGVQLTDSPYVVVSMGTMTRMGSAVLAQIDAGAPWVPAVHSVGAPLHPGQEDAAWPCNANKYIVHFPESREIWSFGSAYGGNAILAKKAFALRIATALGHDEGWVAAHMLLVKVTGPDGVGRHIAAAFPSACGKTNFAMLRPTLPGWTVETLGDDIAWIARDGQGRLRAINPEAGFFGVAPGTGPSTNPVAIEMLRSDTIFTNVALTDDGDVWWEGLTEEAPEHLTDWRGEDWTPASGRAAAHPNSRFTVAADLCPSIADDWNSPQGVTLDAIIFGGRRATQIPLVAQAPNWERGVLFGANLASEQTAAAEGTVGQLRRDPFAMLPFSGIHMADHFADWLRLGADARTPVFQVNWFRKGADGRFLWPGFGENIRVLKWILGRVDGTASAAASPLGWLPTRADIDATSAGLTDAGWAELMAVDAAALASEASDTAEYLESFGDRLPEQLREAFADYRVGLDRPF